MPLVYCPGYNSLMQLTGLAALSLPFSIEDYSAPVAASGWQAICQDEPDAHDHDLDEIRQTHPDMRVYEWDGTPTPVIDPDHNILLLLGGFPPNEEVWGPDVAAKAAEEMEAVAKEIYAGPRWHRKAGLDGPTPRRGSHAAKHVGAAMGGGQRYPQNLAHAACNLLIFTIAGWTNVLFMVFAPDLHEYYRATYAALCDWDRHQECAKHIRRNFLERYSVFTTATYNFGPVTVTVPHINFGNLAWGWCVVTALGSFNPDCGGHLFTPAGIFRWVYNDFRTDKDINAAKSTTQAEREQRKQDRLHHRQEGIYIANTLLAERHRQRAAASPRSFLANSQRTDVVVLRNWITVSPSFTVGTMRAATSDSQRAANSRYREQNKLELRQKVCERMAKHRAKLRQSKEEWAAYTATAQKDAVRYRAQHAEDLALNQAAYHAKKSIAKRGFAAWHDDYLKRHPPPPPQTEELPDWPSDSEDESSASTFTSAIPPRRLSPPRTKTTSITFLIIRIPQRRPTMFPNQVNTHSSSEAKSAGSKLALALGEKAPSNILNVLKSELPLVHREGGSTGGGRTAGAVVVFENVGVVGLGRRPDFVVELIGPRCVGGLVVLGRSPIGVGLAVCPRTVGLGGAFTERERTAAGDSCFGIKHVVCSPKGGDLHFRGVEVVEGLYNQTEQHFASKLQVLLDHVFVDALAAADALEVIVSEEEVVMVRRLTFLQPWILLEGTSPSPATRIQLSIMAARTAATLWSALATVAAVFSQTHKAIDTKLDGRHVANLVADLQTNGFSGYAKRSTKRWAGVGGVKELWALFCDEYHRDGCHAAQCLPPSWNAPTPVVRGCPAPAPAPVAPQAAVISAYADFFFPDNRFRSHSKPLPIVLPSPLRTLHQPPARLSPTPDNHGPTHSTYLGIRVFAR
ncbi:hypothetical protein B0H16DRAFT_1480612 [Mycena metata]|uniref:Uncharacterized protein n=1 Tax=Mycena metata TaxID=1033252 RepID=A0AAD7H323_9AGAR|nr:hypothetical protein B0H16DRAFT_1480612 [Mycena metata]